MDAASRELARNNSCGTLGCTAARFIVRLRHGVDSIYRRLIEPVPGASLPDRPGVGQRNAVACMPARRWTRRCHPARGSCFLWRARNAHQQDEYTVARICHLCSKRSAPGLARVAHTWTLRRTIHSRRRSFYASSAPPSLEAVANHQGGVCMFDNYRVSNWFGAAVLALASHSTWGQTPTQPPIPPGDAELRNATTVCGMVARSHASSIGSRTGDELPFAYGIAPVAGVPYSAVGVTDSTTTFAGGYRITRHETTRFFRDSQGRTRVEHTSPPHDAVLCFFF